MSKKENLLSNEINVKRLYKAQFSLITIAIFAIISLVTMTLIPQFSSTIHSWFMAIYFIIAGYTLWNLLSMLYQDIFVRNHNK